MQKRGSFHLGWRDAALGILTEAAYVGAIVLVATAIAFLVNWGVR